MFVDREISKTLKKNIKNFSSVAITGARQTGKTSLLKKLFSDEYNYISFDDLLVRERALDDPALFMTEIKGKTILDEIQYVPKLLSYLKIEIDNNKTEKGKYILTGSQQFSMMKGISETLAGRIALMSLHTFSFNELKAVAKFKNITTDALSYFEYSCLQGLYPEIAINRQMDSKIWYSSYIQTYLERDIKSVYNIGDLRIFGRFLRLLASRCAQIINYSEISKELGVQVNTIKRWVSILEASKIIYILQPYFRNTKKRLIKSPKIYWMDTGLVCYLTGIYNKEQLHYGLMAGSLFENLIISETVKYMENQGMENEIFFLRTSNKQEIDLLIKSGEKFFPFEIKISKSPKPVMLKPINSLRVLFPKMDIQDAGLICLTEKEFPVTKNATAMNLNGYLQKLSREFG